MYYSLERFQNEQLGSNASISSTVQLLCNLWHSTDDSNQEHINTINALIGSCSNWSDTDQSLELDQYVQCFFHNLLCSSLFRTLHSSNANSSHFHCSSHISWHLTGKGLNWQVFEILPQPTTWFSCCTGRLGIIQKIHTFPPKRWWEWDMTHCPHAENVEFDMKLSPAT